MYLSAAEIAKLEGVHKTHYLNPAAKRLNKSLGDATGLRHIGVHLIRVEPGHQSTEYHVHRFEEEGIYVIEGRGLAVLGERLQPVGPGDFIGCPANGVAHELIADGEDALVCLVMGQRLQHDVCDYPRLGKRLFRNAGEWNLVDHENIEQVKR
jgi:uncharacterized cupin superfamily protein